MAGFTLDTLSVLTVAKALTASWRASNSKDLHLPLSPSDKACETGADVTTCQPHGLHM